MKVALIDPSLFTWPYDRALGGALAGLGHETRIFGKALPAEDPRTADPLFAPIFYASLASPAMARLPRVATRLWKGISHVGSLRRLIDDLTAWRPDAIHFQWLPLPVIDARFLGRFREIAPLVLTVHDTLPFNGTPGSILQNLGARDIWRAFDRLIVHTRQGEERLREQGIEGGRIVRVAHGLLHADQAPTAPSPRTSAKGSSDAPIEFLLFGQIKPYKGVDVVIRALARLSHDLRSRCRVRIAGKPYMDMAPLLRLAKELGVEDSIVFDLRFIPDDEVAGMMAGADALLFPYREIEASGVLMATIAHGRPLIASRLGAFGEMIVDGKNGLLVTPGDDQALAAALSMMILQPENRARMATGMMRLRDSVPSWADIARQTAGIYGSLGESRRAGWTAPAPIPADAGDRARVA
jgi:glycosyltransferase involved in cell wall biosynthesis